MPPAKEREMGTIAIQTQCCLQERDETDEEEDAPKEKVLVEPVPWYGRCGPAGAPACPQAAVPRSLSETTRVPG